MQNYKIHFHCEIADDFKAWFSPSEFGHHVLSVTPIRWFAMWWFVCVNKNSTNKWNAIHNGFRLPRVSGTLNGRHGLFRKLRYPMGTSSTICCSSILHVVQLLGRYLPYTPASVMGATARSGGPCLLKNKFCRHITQHGSIEFLLCLFKPSCIMRASSLSSLTESNSYAGGKDIGGTIIDIIATWCSESFVSKLTVSLRT